MSWKIIFGTFNCLIWAAAFWMLFRKAEAQRPARICGDGRVEFTRSGFAYLLWILLAADLAWWAIRELLFSKGRPLALMKGVALGLSAAMLLFDLPGTIFITSGGLEQSYWLRRNKRILWKDILEINTGEKGHIVTVTSADGTKIVHSAELADRARLLLELKQHCGDDLPPDFPREPLTQS